MFIFLCTITGKTISCTMSFSCRFLKHCTMNYSKLTALPKVINFHPLFPNSTRLFASTTIKVPNMGDSISEGTLVEWNKNVGDFCEVDDIIAVIETDKVSIDVRTDFSGVLVKQLANIDDTLEVSAPLFEIDMDQKPPPKTAIEQPTETKTPTPSPSPTSTPTPTPKPTESKSAPVIKEIKSQPLVTGERVQKRVQMSRMRQRIAERLKEAQNTAASLTTFNEIDMSQIMQIRSKYKDIFLDTHDIKLGFMSVFVSASVSALKSQPAVNASIDDVDKCIVYNEFCDISVAVASPNGLVVPVIRDVHLMSFADIEKSIQMYASKAKNNKLSLEEMSGGTFTISNGGVFGSLYGTPIINVPQSAILGMHGVFDKPVVIDGKIEIRPMMYVALTYDHRIIDGREAVLFLKRIKECVEDPVRLLLGV